MLAVRGVLVASVAVALGAAKSGLPAFVAFLVLGMLLGSDGPGGIAFHNAELAREVGVVALAAILYESGLSTSWRGLREVTVPALLLSTLGVVVTAAIAGVTAYAKGRAPTRMSVSPGVVLSATSLRCRTRHCLALSDSGRAALAWGECAQYLLERS
jgi:cell volume regulation protein A